MKFFLYIHFGKPSKEEGCSGDVFFVQLGPLQVVKGKKRLNQLTHLEKRNWDHVFF
jgi:hypothetical protein